MTKSFLGGFVAGAALMYFADPICGKRRRAVARDKFKARCHDVTRELDKAERDTWNRAHGIGAAVSGVWKTRDTADQVS